MYEKGLIRSDRGLFTDKGNLAYDPVHPDFGGTGADPSGVRDSRTAFATCDADAVTEGIGVRPSAGTYLIDSDITLAAGWDLVEGVVIQPDSGVTVTFSNYVRGMGARATQLDTSRGGSFTVSGSEVFFGGTRPVFGFGTKQGFANTGRSLDAIHVGADSAPVIHGYNDGPSSSAGSIQGIEGHVTASHDSGTLALGIGTVGIAEATGDGTSTFLRGVQAGGGYASGAGTITEWAAFYAAGAYNLGSGNIATAYGLYVVDQTAGDANYAIYTEGGWVRLGGLPTAATGLPSGTLWNDAGTVKVA